jgi:hypothetical protein
VFTTILGQATRFFDRRALVSGFAPNVLFWSLALAAFAAATRGWQGSLDWWQAQSGTAQAVLLAGAVAWLVVAGVLTVNWHATLARTFEGYWPDSGLWEKLTIALRNRSTRRWQEIADRDSVLEKQLIDALDQLRTRPNDKELTAKAGRLEVKRQALGWELFLYFPREPEAIMPTRLGNVLRAAELYSLDRYRLDSVVVWPRLESTFEDGLPDQILDAKTSLDLMVTLSAFSLLFGIPIAGGLAYGVAWDLPVWVPVLVLAAGLVTRLWAATAVAASSLALAVVATASSWHAGELHQAALGCLVLAGALLLAGLTYRNAVEAAVAYGEQIKAVLDVHRWRLLEALKLPTPATIDEERELWEDVSELLYRGSRPRSKLYRYVTSAAEDGTARSEQKTQA